jgi:hypothetical protein
MMKTKTKIIGSLTILILLFLILLPVKASPPPAKLIVFSYTIKINGASPTDVLKKCRLNGYLGGSIYRNRNKATGELKPYTTCFFYMWDEKSLSFYIAKPYTGLNGVILPGDRLKLVFSPVPGNIQPKNIGAGDYCLSPWYLTDEELTQIINQAIREHIPNCSIP